MKIRNKLISLAIIAIASGSAYGGVRGGMVYQRQLDQKAAVEAEAAHWDPHSAKFVWGSFEVSRIASLPLTAFKH